MTSAPKILNPQALPADEAVRLLAKLCGRPMTRAMLEADLAAGAPTNGDGTVNLVHYAAWLVRELHARPSQTRPAPPAHDR